MAKYKKYAEYKDSGEEWAGDIPSNWKCNRFKNVFKIRKRIAGKLGYQILSITQRGIKIKDTKSGDGQLSMDYSKYQIVNPNDFAMNHMDLLTGFVDISDHKGVTSPDYRVFTLEDPSSDRRYFLYLLQLCYIGKIFYPLGQGAAQVGRWRLPADAFNQFISPIPSRPEQKQIARFLDHETGKIDRLIQKQQQLIELLKEKRQAVISHAVTKGLNPNAPLKPSNIEWLGDVPEHWEVLPIKYIVSTPITDGPHETPDFIDEGVPFVSAEAVSSGSINFDKIRGYISRSAHEVYSNKYLPERGDIYMVKSGATTGVTAIVETDIEFNIWSPLAVIRSKESSSPYYVLNYLRSSNFLEAVELNWSFGTQQNIGMGVIGNIRIPQPPKDEAVEIAAKLVSQNSKYEALVDRALHQIDLLQERRTALISAAVTGKIDVRDWQPPTEGKSEEEKG